jgi:hypothetical protein
MARMLIQEMTLMELVDFFALKYLQAKRKFTALEGFEVKLTR